MPARITSSRLAARAGIINIDAVLQAEAAADALDRTFHETWAALLTILARHTSFHHTHRLSRHLMAGLHARLETALADRLGQLGRWAHRETARAVVETLPPVYLNALAQKKTLPGDGQGALMEGIAHAEWWQQREAKILLEKDTSIQGPGLLSLGITPAGKLVSQDLAKKLKEPLVSLLSEDEKKKVLAELLFPPPDSDLVNSVIYASDWRARLRKATSLADPEQVASILAHGAAAGKTQEQVAKELLPVVQGVRSTARRLARTYGLEVAHTMQLRTFEQMADITEGYQVHATLDERTRPRHRHRHGTIYYRDPKPGQKGFDEMPRPPREADGEMAWNCRCHLSPVLKPVERILSSPKKLAVFTQAAGKAIPDPVTYSEWFAETTERRRRLAVGSRRYSAAKDRLGREPEWEDFIDPDGGVLTINRIKVEKADARKERVARVRQGIAQRRELVQQTSTLGFVSPATKPAGKPAKPDGKPARRKKTASPALVPEAKKRQEAFHAIVVDALRANLSLVEIYLTIAHPAGLTLQAFLRFLLELCLTESPS